MTLLRAVGDVFGRHNYKHDTVAAGYGTRPSGVCYSSVRDFAGIGGDNQVCRKPTAKAIGEKRIL